MTHQTETEPKPRRGWQEDLSASGEELVERVKSLVNEGNVRRVIIKQDDRTLVELPLTIGVVGVLLAPQLAAIGALAALVTRCTITVEREEPDASAHDEPTESPPATDA